MHKQPKESTNQQELDEMKLKYNLLYEENAELKSQLDTMRKQLKENRKLVEKYRNLKDKMEPDLVCYMFSLLDNHSNIFLSVYYHPKQEHLRCKKGEANQKQQL